MRRMIGSVLALALLLGAPSTLLAQAGMRAAVGGRGVEGPAFDYFLSRYRAAGAAESGSAEAVGARLMWPVASRAALGGYVVRVPDESDWSRTWRYGAQADLRVTGEPVAGRVDPLLSLGVGASREEDAPGPRLARSTDGRTHLSVAPGVGLRLRLAPGLGVRGDARQVLDFRDRVQRNIELSGGLSIGV